MSPARCPYCHLLLRGHVTELAAEKHVAACKAAKDDHAKPQ